MKNAAYVVTALAIVVVAVQSIAEATWVSSVPPGASVTAGTDTPWAGNDHFTVDAGGNASTNFRAKCDPCPNCTDREDLVWGTYWFVCKDAQGNFMGGTSDSIRWCECPTDALAAGPAAGCAGAASATVTIQIKCGCCDETADPTQQVEPSGEYNAMVQTEALTPA